MRPAISARLGAVLLAAALASCTPTMKVRLATPQETVDSLDLVVEEPEHPRPRYDTVKLFDEQKRVIWHLRAEPFGDDASQAHLTLGQAPPGFAEVVPAPKLVEGTYMLVVSGEAHGQLLLHVDGRGRVTAGAPGDLSSVPAREPLPAAAPEAPSRSEDAATAFSACVAACEARNQMRAVAPEVIRADCERTCSAAGAPAQGSAP
jgi:hypothetical protein